MLLMLSLPKHEAASHARALALFRSIDRLRD